MTWEYIFWLWATTFSVGDSLCFTERHRISGTIGFGTYQECKDDGHDIALSGFKNYEPVELQGGCFEVET